MFLNPEDPFPDVRVGLIGRFNLQQTVTGLVDSFG